MDGLTVFFIVFFGIAALIPATWSIVGLIQGNTKFWPGVLGTVWAVGLMVATFIGIGTNWGGCPPGSASSKGAIQCFAPGGEDPSCQPDVWKLECQRQLIGTGCPTPSPTATPLPAGRFCPPGQTAVFPFCEPIQLKRVKQPWATWSDLSFVAAGLWILWWFHFYQRSESLRMAADIEHNPMLMIGWLSVVYGLIAIFMGPPSMWFHASLKDWAGWFDTMSVVVWLGFNAVYVAYALFRTMWDKGRKTERTILVLVFWFILVFICGAIATSADLRLVTYFITGGLWGLAEAAYLITGASAGDKVKYQRNGWLIGGNILLLAGTMTLWIFYNDGIVTTGCADSRKDFPGHALFHILASFSTILTFISFASERRVEGSN